MATFFFLLLSGDDDMISIPVDGSGAGSLLHFGTGGSVKKAILFWGPGVTRKVNMSNIDPSYELKKRRLIVLSNFGFEFGLEGSLHRW